MKKNILLIIVFLASLTIKAQVFYSENFASGIPVGWTNVDNSGNNILWRTTTTGSINSNVLVDTALNPNGTTAANGYLIIDSDSAGQAVTEESILTSTAINCASHANVHLTFNEYFAQYLTSTGTVSVSNDNITWVDVHFAHAGLSINQGTPNPNALDIDITAYAGGQSTVYLRFSYHGEWDYWWFIDDIGLYEPAPIDFATQSIQKLNSEYTLIPYLQATGLTMSGVVKNNGSTAAGGSALFEVINTGTTQTVFSEVITIPTLAVGASQNIFPVNPFIPSSAGSYKSKITLTVAGDGNSANDVMESSPILLSDTVYARDDDQFAGTQGIGVGPGEDAITGQNFRVNVNDNLTSITFFLKDGFGAQAAGTPVYFTVHPQLDSATYPDESIVLATSETLLVTPGMIPVGGAYYTVPLQGGPLALTPGLYFVGIHETDSILTIGYSNSIYTPGAVWVHWNSIPSPPAVNGWAHAEDFTVTVAYMIRANFASHWDAITRISNSIELNVFPNPASQIITLRMTGSSIEKNYDVSIVNTLGKEVFSDHWNGKCDLKVDLLPIKGGLYTVMVKSADTYISRKILVSR